MSHRRKSRGLDPELRRQGVVPWTAEGLADAITHAVVRAADMGESALLETTAWIQKRHPGDRGLAHNERFYKTMRFIARHRSRLLEQKLLVENEEGVHLHAGLLRLLAGARYECRVASERLTGGWEYGLDEESILSRATIALGDEGPRGDWGE